MAQFPFLKVPKKKFLRESAKSKNAKAGTHPCILVLDHLKPGFNVAKLFRTANVFGCEEIILVGIESFDVRAAMGAFKHTAHKKYSSMEEALDYLKQKKFSVYALSLTGQKHLHQTKLAQKTAFVLGHEENGLSFNSESFKDVTHLKIPQFGEIQSLNVSIAGSIAVYEYLLQQHFLKGV